MITQDSSRVFLDGLTAAPSLDLTQTLQLVADTIVESLGFGAAVINLVEDDQQMVVAAVSGPSEVRELLLHRRQGREGWSKLLEASEPWGRLRFLDHANFGEDPADITSWIPDIAVLDSPDAWHPEDALFAPLLASDGALIGMLSVDMPVDGMRPGPATRRALEAFAVAASLAIEHAALAAESQRGARRFRAVFDSSPVAIALIGSDGRFSGANDALCRFLGRRRQEIVGSLPSRFSDPTAPDAAAAPPWTARQLIPGSRKGDPAPVEVRYLLPDGSPVWGRLHIAPLGSVDEPGILVAQIEDITDRKRAEERLVREAHFDSLTGLPNRAQSMLHLVSTLEDPRRSGMTAVFFCDLDRLKLVNDGYGHAVGDAYILEVSRRIRASVRDADLVGRLSGDEFVVVLGGVESPAEAIGLAGRIIEGVRQPLQLGGVSFTPSVSLGIACATGTATTADELLAQADSAMYRVKLEDRGSWQVYDSTMGSSAAAQLRLRSDITRALAEQEFVLHYQPIVRLDDRQVIGHEALLRWEHPRRGLLAPAEFLDVILGSEYESPVTDWVIRTACADAMRRPVGSRRVAVNVSSLQVGRRDLPELLRSCFAETGLDPKDLVLELTEDRLLSHVDGAERLAALHDVGVVLAIDDFGSGYAGLGYLQRFSTLDIVKLDRSFISGLGVDSASEHIVRSMVQLARGCGLTLVTEGVETDEQADLLLALGVEAAQGYLFGRPHPDKAPATGRAPEPQPLGRAQERAGQRVR